MHYARSDAESAKPTMENEEKKKVLEIRLLRVAELSSCDKGAG